MPPPPDVRAARFEHGRSLPWFCCQSDRGLVGGVQRPERSLGAGKPPPPQPPPIRPRRARVGAASATVGAARRARHPPSRRRAVPARRTLAAPGPRRCPLCRTVPPAGLPPSPPPTAIVAPFGVARVPVVAWCQCAGGLSRFPRALRPLHRRRCPPGLTPRRRRHRAAVGWVDQPVTSDSCRPVLSTCLVVGRSPTSCLVPSRSRLEVARATTTTTRSSPTLCRPAPRTVILRCSALHPSWCIQHYPWRVTLPPLHAPVDTLCCVTCQFGHSTLTVDGCTHCLPRRARTPWPYAPVSPDPPPSCPCWHPVLVLAAAPASRHYPFVMTRHRRIWALLEAVSGGCRFLPLLRWRPATVSVAEVMEAPGATAAATARTCLPCRPQQATSLTAHPRRPRPRRGLGTPMHRRGSAAVAVARGYRSPHRRAPFSRRRASEEGAPVHAG